LYFVEHPGETSDPQDRLKERLKRFLGKYYYTIGVNILAPNFPFNYRKAILDRLDPAQQVVVDIGSGNHRVHEEIICVDLFDYEAVDIVCDVEALPFRAESIDACVSRSMLEHVPNPHRVVSEFQRITRPAGLGLHLIPFLMPFHASPHDFQRYTDRGAALLFQDWDLVEQTAPTGPVSALLNVLVEFLAILFSFGRSDIKSILYLAFCALLFPVKYLDAPFVHRRAFLTVAPNILTVVRKMNRTEALRPVASAASAKS
jgi:ubiquinone/menaquinone biosynthesis C-methylase UbiE